VYEGPNVENEAESLEEVSPGGHLCSNFAWLFERGKANYCSNRRCADSLVARLGLSIWWRWPGR
jgi:hypothetical protein